MATRERRQQLAKSGSHVVSQCGKVEWAEDVTFPVAKFGAGGEIIAKQSQIIGLRGPFNCCDVYIDATISHSPIPAQLTQTGWDDVYLTLWALNGHVRTPLQVKLVSDQQGRVIQNRFNAVLFSIRGRECDGFEVTARMADGTTLQLGQDVLLPANFRMELWSYDGSAPNDRQGAQRVEPFAQPHQQLTFTGQFDDGEFVVFDASLLPEELLNRRIFITHLTVTSDTAPDKELLLLNPGPAPVMQWWVNSSPITVDFTYPLRGLPGTDWRIAVMTPAAQVLWVNIVGYIE